MADFKKALEIIMGFEGVNNLQNETVDDNSILICSNCFKDEGLKNQCIFYWKRK